VVAARATADNAAADLARYRASETGAVSRQSIDAAVELARAQIAERAADLASAQARVEQASLQLEYTRVHAAEAGRVTSKNVAPGDYVQMGQQLFALVPRRVWVTANFKETQLRRMRPGQPAVIHVDAYGRDFRGRVDSVQAGSGAAFSLLPPENATGNYVKIVQRVPVKIVFEDEGVDAVVLGPGMSAEPTVDVR
jgi:membrane fusion protein (multidrug efflux system)